VEREREARDFLRAEEEVVAHAGLRTERDLATERATADFTQATQVVATVRRDHVRAAGIERKGRYRCGHCRFEPVPGASVHEAARQRRLARLDTGRCKVHGIVERKGGDRRGIEQDVVWRGEDFIDTELE